MSYKSISLQFLVNRNCNLNQFKSIHTETCDIFRPCGHGHRKLSLRLSIESSYRLLTFLTENDINVIFFITYIQSYQTQSYAKEITCLKIKIFFQRFFCRLGVADDATRYRPENCLNAE